MMNTHDYDRLDVHLGELLVVGSCRQMRVSEP
jgi:hypothetical protein